MPIYGWPGLKVTGSPQVVDLFQSAPSTPELPLSVPLVLLGFVAVQSFQSYDLKMGGGHLAYLETGPIRNPGSATYKLRDTVKGLNVSEFQHSPLK